MFAAGSCSLKISAVTFCQATGQVVRLAQAGMACMVVAQTLVVVLVCLLGEFSLTTSPINASS
jgi:hypothetical protein